MWPHGNKQQEPPKYQAVGILYARKNGSVVEMKVLYEEHVEQDIKDAIVAKFGIGAILWGEK